jgi:hypothetical protein
MAGTGDTSIKSYDFYNAGTAGAAFALQSFLDTTTGVNFISTGIIIVNDGAGNLQISFDGTTVHGLIQPAEVITFDWRRKKGIYLRGIGGSTPNWRLWAW